MSDQENPDYSVVVPALNEAESIAQLYEEVSAIFSRLDASWELLFIDDGSEDGTVAEVEKLQAQDPRVMLLQFTRNFGKSAAYMAAFARVNAPIVITMDADLQDDPAELPKLLDVLKEGNDLVVGWKMHRLENEPTKTLPSRVFNYLNRFMFGIELKDQNSGYRVMRTPVARTLELNGDQYRFIPQLANLAGFKVAETGVKHRKRQHGHSKYGASRFWTGLLDLFTVRFLTRYRRRPLHFFGTLALVLTLLGCGLEAYVLGCKLLGDTFQQHIAALIVGVMMILIGFQCLIIGLIGELFSAPQQPQYVLVSKGSIMKKSGQQD